MLQKQQHILLKGEIWMIHLLKLESEIFPNLHQRIYCSRNEFSGKAMPCEVEKST